MLIDSTQRMLQDQIEQLHLADEDIVVLKGFPLSWAGVNDQSKTLDEINQNKLSYFMKTFGTRKIFPYEEFLLLSKFIIDQYSHIYVIENNLFSNLFVIDAPMSSDLRDKLINHFSDSDEISDDSEIGTAMDVINIFNGLQIQDGVLIGAYNDESILSSSEKIREISLYQGKVEKIFTCGKQDGIEYDDLIEEKDYAVLVKKVFEITSASFIYVRTANYTNDKTLLNNQLAILQFYCGNEVKIYDITSNIVSPAFEHRKEYNEILKKYWGYDSFRSFDIYDLNKLQQGQKVTVPISQEQIISDLVTQVEACHSEEKSHRDVFVTAPTGSGKSVIFQVPAIYLAEKYNLLTIVISPLIGLMNDQVSNLENRNYQKAKTINSDISPIIKQEILDKVAGGQYHILYLSPETLLARSDVEQLIGDRTIGMIVVDEAHIVTTWGKQFRPDYWYLGEHIRKLRKRQMEKKGCSFIIATFTATAIYRGIEDMYEETRNSLHMIDPITYLGCMKRNDINIIIDKTKMDAQQHVDYETDKFNQIRELVERALITNKKTLIYFPTISLINKCAEYLQIKDLGSYVSKYYGTLTKDEKDESYHAFLSGKKKVMLATKAFGMGIDIDDIDIVAHFAPTGNVCDYVQEIGRAARKPGLQGEAYYHYDSHDFKFINQLHGLSIIKPYQLINVIRKIDELYTQKQKIFSSTPHTRKKNALLLDAENFSYIFESPYGDSEDNINKVKTALLLIQKDFEARYGYSPILVRPIPLFSRGYFVISPRTRVNLLKAYPKCLSVINEDKKVCSLDLNIIWNKDYSDKSFPQFKYLIYSRNKDFDFNKKYLLEPALCIDLTWANQADASFRKIWGVFKRWVSENYANQKYVGSKDFAREVGNKLKIGEYKAQSILDVLIATMIDYRKDYFHQAASLFNRREMKNGETIYQFKTAVQSYLNWVESEYRFIWDSSSTNNVLYVPNAQGIAAKEICTVLGILEALNILTFKINGGANSQIYIYVYQISRLKSIIAKPSKYRNRLLELVKERHLISTKMLTYIYEQNFTSGEIWDILENYFLGIIPDYVKKECKKINKYIDFPSL
jgi:ATP-dependent DNA helicase RecQ